MLRRLALRDFVIVPALDIELGAGFTVLTGETGAGKSILVDALQLALGGRGDAGVVREGAPRADIGAEFDLPESLTGWLEAAGFDAGADGALLLRRVIDAQGKSRAWVNGSPATVTQLREVAEHLIDIHGQHAWQALTRPGAVRALLDAQAGIELAPLAAAWARRQATADALAAATTRQEALQRDRERLAWQLGEVDKLAPGDDEWPILDAEHRRLANAQALIDGARAALDAVSEGEENADALAGRAVDALRGVVAHDDALAEVAAVIDSAQAQLQDAARTLAGYLHRIEPDPAQLRALDDRMAVWVGLARRHRVPPGELPALAARWRTELQVLDAAADTEALTRERDAAERAWRDEAMRVGDARRAAAPRLAQAVTDALQHLGMAGGRFEVVLTPVTTPQSYGLEAAEFLVAGHAGSTPRPLARVASGGELSRIALAIAVTTAGADVAAGDAARPAANGVPAAANDADVATPATLIFDEVDAGIGGTVAETVGRLMRRLGRRRQVLAVTHLPQVAAAADRHLVVSKTMQEGGNVASRLDPVAGAARTAEIARMLGGGRTTGTGLAHAGELLAAGAGEEGAAPAEVAASGELFPTEPPPAGAAGAYAAVPPRGRRQRV